MGKSSAKIFRSYRKIWVRCFVGCSGFLLLSSFNNLVHVKQEARKTSPNKLLERLKVTGNHENSASNELFYSILIKGFDCSVLVAFLRKYNKCHTAPCISQFIFCRSSCNCLISCFAAPCIISQDIKTL